MRRHVLAAFTILSVVLSSRVVSANQPKFSNNLLKFELTGNAPGHIVDDFTTGPLAPWSTNGYGTAAQSNGSVQLSSPGIEQSDEPLAPLISSQTDIFPPASYQVYPGAGDFTATATWDKNTLPRAPGGAIIFEHAYDVVGTNDAITIGVGILNTDPAFAAATSQFPGAYVVPGLAVVQFETRYSHSGSPFGTTKSISGTSIPIQAGSVTGNVAVRIHYDDATRTYTSSVSIDGGQNFSFQFPPIPSGMSASLGGTFEIAAWQTIPEHPVVIVPGFMASQILEPTNTDACLYIETVPKSLLVIDPAAYLAALVHVFFQLRRLQLDPSGILNTTGASTTPGNIMDGTSTQPCGNSSDEFSQLIGSLTKLGLVPGDDLIPCPFDWRLDVVGSAADLNACVQKALASRSTPTSVDIVAHSLGGLVARQYINRFGTSAVSSVTYLSTPHDGTPLAYDALAFGDLLNTSVLKLPLLTKWLGQSLSSVWETFPAIADLLPVKTPFLGSAYTDTTFSIGQTYGLTSQPPFHIANSHIREAIVFRNSIDSDSKILSVPQYNVMGDGLCTYSGALFLPDPANPRVAELIPEMGDGDTVVPTRSLVAAPGTPSTPAARTLLQNLFVPGVDHGSLPNDPRVGKLVSLIVSGAPVVDANGNPAVKPMTTSPSGPARCTIWHTGSPVEITVTDGAGDVTGKNASGASVNEVPGAEYFQFPNNEAGVLPANGTYDVHIQPTASGTFSLVFQQIGPGNLPAGGFRYDNVPIALGDKGQLQVSPSNTGPDLLIDQGGTGTSIKTVHATVVAPMRGDLDTDGDVDQDDLNMVLAARGMKAMPGGDPRDLDGDGEITGLDARELVTLCTRPGCATGAQTASGQACGLGYEIAFVIAPLLWWRSRRRASARRV